MVTNQRFFDRVRVDDQEFAEAVKAYDLGKCLEIAIADARLLSKIEGFELDMSSWVRVNGEDCSVCLAGAAMVRRSNACRSTEPCDMNDNYERVYYAIDSLRQGLITCDWYDFPKNLKNMAAFLEVRRRINKNTGRAPWRCYDNLVKVLKQCKSSEYAL
jgi:hypothetical protein